MSGKIRFIKKLNKEVDSFVAEVQNDLYNNSDSEETLDNKEKEVIVGIGISGGTEVLVTLSSGDKILLSMPILALTELANWIESRFKEAIEDSEEKWSIA